MIAWIIENWILILFGILMTGAMLGAIITVWTPVVEFLRKLVEDDMEGMR